MATAVIGDVHGCLDELQDLLGVLRLGPGDDVVLVGDLISKGPDSAGVVDWARRTPNMRSVLGNHELRYVEAARDGRRPSGKPYDAETLRQLGAGYEAAVAYFQTLPPTLSGPDWLVVHGGFDPRRPLEGQDASVLANMRRLEGGQTAWYELYKGTRLVLFGHWVHREPVLRPNAAGLDTGCVYGGKLTAMVLPERRLISVPARRAYAERKNWL